MAIDKSTTVALTVSVSPSGSRRKQPAQNPGGSTWRICLVFDQRVVGSKVAEGLQGEKYWPGTRAFAKELRGLGGAVSRLFTDQSNMHCRQMLQRAFEIAGGVPQQHAAGAMPSPVLMIRLRKSLKKVDGRRRFPSR